MCAHAGQVGPVAHAACGDKGIWNKFRTETGSAELGEICLSLAWVTMT